MELSAFVQILSNNQDEVQGAINSILKASEDPSYIQLLFQFLQTQECQSNLSIEKGIHITILEIIRRNWKSFNDLSESSAANIYWNEEQQSEIFTQLLEILFSTPYSRRENIIECFRYIIIGSFPNNINVAENLIHLLDEHSTSYEDVTTISNILVFWSKACGKSYIPDELLEVVETISLEIINRFAAFSLQIDPPQSFCLLRFVSKSLKNFIKKLNSPFNCENFDNILSALVNSLTVDNENLRGNYDFYLLKRSALNLFIELCSTFFPNLAEKEEEEEIGIHAQYSIHFKENIAPILLQSLIECLSIEQDSYILSSIIYLFYLFLRFDVGDRLFLTTEFITDLIIPVARLTANNIDELESNPLQYIAFNLSYKTSAKTRTQRNATAALLGEILKNEQYIDDLYDFLLAPTVNQIDFEGRIFLMTKFVLATMSEYGPMIGEEIVEALVEQTKQVNLLPPFLIASLLMFMSSVLPFSNPELGCVLACECIIQSDSDIVVCTASKLLRSSIKECDERVEIPITDIIPKLLNLASEVKYKHLTKSVEALIQMGGDDILPFVKDTVVGLLDLCNQSLSEESSKECSATLYSIFEIINPIPDDEPTLVELSEIALPACIAFLTNFPENNSFKDIFLLISLFNTKIDDVTSTMIETYNQVLQIIRNDIDVYLNAMDYIAFIMCPIIANQEFKTNQKLIDSTFEILLQFINECMKEEDKDGLAYSILIAASLIQSISEPAFVFLPYICNALSGVDDKSSTCLFSACVFAFSSALIVNTDEAIQKISKEAIDFVLPQINKSTCQTYKELKMGMIFLLKATLLGLEDAYVSAVNNLQPLCERREENEMNLEDKMKTASQLIQDQDDDDEAEFAPLVIPFNLPSDGFDELELFGEVTQNSGLFQKLPPQLQRIVNDIFQ